ncbi:type I restriction enzyme HsdR N-terminal domain-containing protein [Desulfocurvus sp. DL9XJH121]
MHETSKNAWICDYLTGEEIEMTTYEDCRQTLEQRLVENLDYPKAQLSPKVGVTFPIKDKSYCRVVDVVARDPEGRPVLLLFFTAGQPGTFDREIVAAARLIEGGPAPLALATDTKEVVLHETATGALVWRGGYEDLPGWERVRELAGAHPARPLGPEALEREARILYTYSEYIYGACCYTCPPKPSKA